VDGGKCQWQGYGGFWLKKTKPNNYKYDKAAAVFGVYHNGQAVLVGLSDLCAFLSNTLLTLSLSLSLSLSFYGIVMLITNHICVVVIRPMKC
jgi:hypothetical protein